MMILGETACSTFSPYSVSSHFYRVFPELPEPWASGILQSSLPVSLLKLPKRLMINSWFRTEASLSIEVLTWTLPDCPEAVKVEKEKNSCLLRGKNRAGREELCHTLMEDFCEPRKPVPFQTSQNTLCFCLCLLKTSSCCRGAVGALFILFEQQPETWKTRGRRENSFRMKKRLPNLSSAIILPLLSYLAQSPTGRCQSGRMSTPGKCVYRKPVPRVRIPPCPPSIFHRNIFVMDILRFLFAGVWGKYWENE